MINRNRRDANHENKIDRLKCFLCLNICVTPSMTIISFYIVLVFISIHMNEGTYGDNDKVQADARAGIVIIVLGIVSFWIICLVLLGKMCYLKIRHRQQQDQQQDQNQDLLIT